MSTILVSPPVSAASITLEPSYWGGDAVYNYHLHLEGVIEAGDLQTIQRLLGEADIPETSWIAFSMNSPGGDLDEGIKIAEFMQDLPIQVATDVVQKDGSPGSCASACSVAYLGGHFRWLSEGSELGVHQFRYVTDAVDLRSTNTQRVQSDTAEITRIISKANVDADYYSLMASTAPSDMTWIEPDVLRDLFVITDDLSYQDARLKLDGGNLSLIMTQIGMYGANRLTAQCLNGGINFRSEIAVEGTDPKNIDDFTVLLDRYPVEVAITSNTQFEELIGTTEFALSNKALSAIISSERMDVRLVSDLWGFFGTGFDLRGDDLADLIETCITVSPSLPSDFGTELETEDPLSPVQTTAMFGSGFSNPDLLGDPTPSEELISDDDLKAFFDHYLAKWSSPNDEAMPAMSRSYADTLDFYGDIISREELLKQKRDFAERWPVRTYTARHDQFEIRCLEVNACMVATLIDWQASNADGSKTSKGVAWYGLGVDLDTGQIVFEDGESRRY
jgi:ATP-dependent protease ClpP protease subunit